MASSEKKPEGYKRERERCIVIGAIYCHYSTAVCAIVFFAIFTKKSNIRIICFKFYLFIYFISTNKGGRKKRIVN